MYASDLSNLHQLTCCSGLYQDMKLFDNCIGVHLPVQLGGTYSPPSPSSLWSSCSSSQLGLSKNTGRFASDKFNPSVSRTYQVCVTVRYAFYIIIMIFFVITQPTELVQILKRCTYQFTPLCTKQDEHGNDFVLNMLNLQNEYEQINLSLKQCD